MRSARAAIPLFCRDGEFRGMDRIGDDLRAFFAYALPVVHAPWHADVHGNDLVVSFGAPVREVNGEPVLSGTALGRYMILNARQAWLASLPRIVRKGGSVPEVKPEGWGG